MGPRLRTPATLAAAVLGLHQLRYVGGHGAQAGEALAREGHGYLSIAGPLVAALAAVALAELGLAWRRRQPPGAPITLGRRWLGAAVALAAVYTLQETLEGVLAPGHPAGLAAVVGGGGWLALPLAVVLGWVVALVLGGTDALLVKRARAVRRLPRPISVRRAPGRRLAIVRAPLPRHLAGRAPPLCSCRP